MTLAGRLDGWLRPEAPPERLALARILVGGFATVYLLSRFRYFADLSSLSRAQFSPVGLCNLLGAPLPPALTWTLATLAVLAGITFTVGARHRLIGPIFFVLFLWVTTYRSSWGKILHTENLLVWHLLLVVLGPSSDALSLDARRASPPLDPTRPDHARAYGFVLRAMTVVTALTYFIAGVTKLRHGGGAWLSGEALGDWLAFDALRKIELGSTASPLGPLLAQSPLALRALALLTLTVELGAPLALLHKRALRIWTLLAWGFHMGILAAMAIVFVYPLFLITYAPAFPLERLPLLRNVVARFSREQEALGDEVEGAEPRE